MKNSLRHASSRKVFLEYGKVIKFYPKLYGYILHEIFRILFQIFNGVYSIDFISRKRRIHNEFYARKVLESLGIKTTKISTFSSENYFLEELLEYNSKSLDDVEQTNVILAAKQSEIIGGITRMLNDAGYYFIDNRASNWLIKNGGKLVRTDLEIFRHEDLNKYFYAKCDYLSFLSSVESSLVKERFIRGYGKRMKYFSPTEFLVRLYIKLTDSIF